MGMDYQIFLIRNSNNCCGAIKHHWIMIFDRRIFLVKSNDEMMEWNWLWLNNQHWSLWQTTNHDDDLWMSLFSKRATVNGLVECEINDVDVNDDQVGYFHLIFLFFRNLNLSLWWHHLSVCRYCLSPEEMLLRKTTW